MLMQPSLGQPSAAGGSINPYATTTRASSAKLRKISNASGDLKLTG